MKYILLHGMGQTASSWDETIFSTIKRSGHEVNIDNPKGLAKAMEEQLYRAGDI